TPLLVAVNEHLRVRPGREAVTGSLELAPQLREVVDLAVLDDRARAVLVRDRLGATGEVRDRRPPGGEPHTPLGERALPRRAPARTGPAVPERRRPRREPLPVDRVRGRGDPADPAHVPESTARRGAGRARTTAVLNPRTPGHPTPAGRSRAPDDPRHTRAPPP